MLNLTITDDDGAPYPLTSQRVEIQVKQRSTDTTALYTLSSAGAGPKITITDVPGGLATADFTDVLTTAGTFFYHAYVAATSGTGDTNRHTWAYGQLKVVAV